MNLYLTQNPLFIFSLLSVEFSFFLFNIALYGILENLLQLVYLSHHFNFLGALELSNL